MQPVQPNLFTRPDTFFGACLGLGEDIGLHPNILRIALGGLLFWNPAVALTVYAGLCLVVAFSRWLIPVPIASAAEVRSEPSAEHKPANAVAAQPEDLPLAA